MNDPAGRMGDYNTISCLSYSKMPLWDTNLFTEHFTEAEVVIWGQITYIITCIENNHTYCFVWDVIILPCPNFNDGLAKPPLNSGQGRAIIIHRFVYLWLLIHAVQWVMV